MYNKLNVSKLHTYIIAFFRYFCKQKPARLLQYMGPDSCLEADTKT